MERIIRERKHRLPLDYYRGYVVVSFTLCIKNRIPLFRQPPLVAALVPLLSAAVEAHSCEILVYTFMPDHLHLLLQGTDDKASCYDAVVQFKHRSGYLFHRRNAGARWQKDFYDHILRRVEDRDRHVQYILENPVRAGLADDWRSWPFKGSDVYDLDVWDQNR